MSIHGAGAIAFAESGKRNVQSLAMDDRVAGWERVIAAIKTLQTAANSPNPN